MQKYSIGIVAFSLGLILSPLIFKFLRRTQSIKKIYLYDLVGRTALIHLKSLSQLCGCDIYAKAEFMNPTGSMKDRAALAIIKDAIKNGKLGPHQPFIYEGTTGSTGISLASIGNSLGLKTTVYLPDDLAQEKYDNLQLLNANLIKVRPVSIVDQNHFCRLAESEAKKANAFFCDQFNNQNNLKIHYEQTAEEILDQTNKQIDCFVMSAGTGGTIAGVSLKLKQQIKNIKIILADPPGSSLRNQVVHQVCYAFNEAEGHRLKNPFDTIVEGVGLNRITQNFEKALIDDAFTIQDEETLHMAHFLIQNEGICVGPSSALNCVAAVKASRKYKFKNIVTILCDSGNRYSSKFYSKDYLKQHSINFVPKVSYQGEHFNLDFIN